MRNTPPRTLQLGLVGYPLDHSFSPVLHRAAMKAMGVEGDYHLYPIEPAQEDLSELKELLRQVRNGLIHGLNVTVPYKQIVLRYLDRLTPEAGNIGAVNTIYKGENELVGGNTDAEGFLRDLDSRWDGDRKGSALVIGAGGAARAVAFALSRRSRMVHVAARRRDQAEALLEDLQLNGRALPLPFTEADLKNANPTIIVQATPVGMAPHTAASPWPEGVAFPAEAFVYDLVYNPTETAFLQSVRQAGLACSGGTGMLVEQAALALEIWTGQKAPRDVMYLALERIGCPPGETTTS